MRYAGVLIGGFMAASSLLAVSPNLALAQSAQSAPAFKEDFAEVNGVRLHYASVGQGPLVLFLHGYPAFWYQWKDQMLDLGRDHLAVAPDQRGYNLSSKPGSVDQYQLKYLVEDIRQLAEKLAGRNKKFVLVAHDWGSVVAYVFAMYHPELLDKLIVINAVHPQIFEREVNENPWQRFSSNYMLRTNGYLAPGEAPIDESVSPELAAKQASAGFVDQEVKKGHYTEVDRQKWIEAWSQPGWRAGGLNWYRANHLNPPFNDTHPKEMVTHSWSTQAVTQGAKSLIIKVPTLVIWGVKDGALPPGNLSGIEKYVPNVKVKLYPDEDHWVMMQKYKEVSQDIRDFIDGKDAPKKVVSQ